MPETVLHTEQVVSGEKARWPFITSGADKYVQPSKQGRIFYGWKYSGNIKRPSDYSSEANNPFGPITGSTKIYAIWEGINVYASYNHNVPADGDTDTDLTKISYWAQTTGGTTITNGVTLESVPLDSGQSPIVFTDKGTSVVSNKNVKSIKGSANATTEQKYLKYKATYNGISSDVITITQPGGTPAAPDPTQGFWVSFYSHDPNQCILSLYPTTTSQYIAGSYQVTVYGNVPDGFDLNITYTYRPSLVGEFSVMQIASQAGSEALGYGVRTVEGWYQDPNIGNTWVSQVPTSAVVVCNNGVKVYVHFTRIEQD